jgi:hypothetical protein
MPNIGIANLIHDIHFLLVIYILVGFYLTPIKYLKYYLFIIIIIFLDWNDFDGQCVLTKFETYYRTGIMPDKPPKEGGPEFFRPLVNKYFNVNLSSDEGDRLNNFVFMLCFLFGFIRFINYHKL